MTKIKSGYKPKPYVDNILFQYLPYTEFWETGEGMGEISTLLYELMYFCEISGYPFDRHLGEAKERHKTRMGNKDG